MLRTRCGNQGRTPLTWGICERHPAGAGSSVEAGWRLSRRGRIITMADRYQDRPFPADDDYDRGGDPHASARGESDPLAELARLIGQTDPFGTMGRANQPVPPRHQRAASLISTTGRAGRSADLPSRRSMPSRPARRPGCSARPGRRLRGTAEDPPPDYPSAVHPLQRYARPRAAAPEPEYDQAPLLCRRRCEHERAIRRAMMMRCTAQIDAGARRSAARSGLCG